MPMMRWIEGRNVVPVLCALAVTGAALYSLVVPRPETALDPHVGEKKFVITGVVIADPDRREKVAMVTVKSDLGPRVLVPTDPYTEVQYGDRISAEGTLKYPEEFATDSGRTFDYPHYLRAKGVLYTMSFAKIEVLRHGEGNPAVTWLFNVRHWFERGMRAALPQPESDLLGGLLIGTNTLSASTTAEFRSAGVVHIVVLSGYNVSLVLNTVVYLLSHILPRTATYGAGALFVIAFAVMTGATETTIRATVMALIMIVATILHRPKAALHALAIAAAAMALMSPFVVLYDLSFQLSVLATLGLILFADPIMARLGWIPKTLGLREIMATTIATQVTVLPLLILSVGQVSSVFLVTNPLVLPAVPAAMLTGFIASLAALVSPALALPLSSIAYLALHYIIVVTHFFGSIPFSSLPIAPDWNLVILPILALMYLVLFVRLIRRNASQPLHRSGS